MPSFVMLAGEMFLAEQTGMPLKTISNLCEFGIRQILEDTGRTELLLQAKDVLRKRAAANESTPSAVVMGGGRKRALKKAQRVKR